MHVDQADGTTRDFRLRSSAFTPIAFYGTGIWHWQVRARFPGGGASETPGPVLARRGLRAADRCSARRAAHEGQASPAALLGRSRTVKGYRVQIARNNAFTGRSRSTRQPTTSYAPRMTGPAYKDGGALYWRVAAIDEGNNLGAWTTRSLSLSKRLKVTVRGVAAPRAQRVS